MPGAGAVRAIRDRMRAVSNTAKVTRAMELVAASKMRRAQDRALQSRPYAERMRAVLAQLSGYTVGADPDELNPLLQQRTVKHFAIIHITADRGLAGGLNTNMNRAAASLVLEHQPNVESVSVLPVGRKGRDFFRRSGFPIIAEFTNLGDFPSSTDVFPIARIVIDDYIRGELDQVYVAYQQFVNAAVQRPVLRQILPVQAPEGAEARGTDFIFEPSPAQLLETLLPRYVEMQIYEAVLEARASEQSARMVAMRQATDAADEMVSELTLTYNKARQEMITSELLDIVGGTAALNA
ncbi:MAG: ATP synthase F1 subunit gamma [Chloroflexi bacterium]|nr:ATP synthase F1 subunit gamma [Chloroflexota bacterium]MDA1001911.1 ATP synthase F1 subunit gamma [Chloroflexota bacterium]MQC27801.1 ATP synthase F1 subunit gamma [Chloroflexota bacterium]